MMMAENLETYRDFAVDFARQAGVILKDAFFALDKSVEHKPDTTPVTETDKHINDLLIAAVGERFSGHSVLGEEKSNMQPGDKQVWVADPIDGTEGFIWGLPTATTALAYVEDGVPLVGVVYDPLLDRMFTAIKNEGAFMNGQPIHVNDATNLERQYFSGPSTFKDAIEKQAFFTEIRDEGGIIAMAYGGIFKACLLAEGRLVGKLMVHNTPHDVAAVKVIIEEAGGKVTDLAGNEQRYDRSINGAIQSNGLIHGHLLELVVKHGIKVVT